MALPEPLAERLEVLASAEGVTVSRLVRSWCERLADEADAASGASPVD